MNGDYVDLDRKLQYLPVEDVDELVFHYTSLSTAIEKILWEKQLHLSPISLLNDPFEAMAKINGSCNPAPLNKMAQEAGVSPEEYRYSFWHETKKGPTSSIATM